MSHLIKTKVDLNQISNWDTELKQFTLSSRLRWAFGEKRNFNCLAGISNVWSFLCSMFLHEIHIYFFVLVVKIHYFLNGDRWGNFLKLIYWVLNHYSEFGLTEYSTIVQKKCSYWALNLNSESGLIEYSTQSWVLNFYHFFGGYWVLNNPNIEWTLLHGGGEDNL